jgi:recombination protein U
MAGRQGGYKWEDAFKKSVLKSYPDAFIYKLIDTHSIEGLLNELKKKHLQYENFLIPKVPADFVIIVDGQTYFIECKSTVSQTSFPLRNIKDHQFEFAANIELAGGTYWFCIRREEKSAHECFLINLNTIIKLKGDKKSITWEDMRDCPDVIKPPRINKSTRFNFAGIF